MAPSIWCMTTNLIVLAIAIVSFTCTLRTDIHNDEPIQLLPDSTLARRLTSSPNVRTEVFKSQSSSLNPSLIHIEILSPKNPRKFQYSVVVLSPNNYTGVATLITEPAGDTRPFPALMFEWSPIVEGEYEMVVHEVPKDAEDHPVNIAIDRISLRVERQNDDIVSIQERMQHPPCSRLDTSDAYSVWSGDWLGPGLGLELNDTLRSGWMFLPGNTMNCTIPTFSQTELLQVPEQTSIYILGTSRERGVFLSLVDLLLSPDEKEHLDISVVGKCWGRATVQKGNITLLYQDFRVIHFESPGKTRTMECHNNMIAKLGDKLFIENAWEVWNELFEVEDNWPDVVHMLTNDGPNYDFEYHTKSFVQMLPKSWDGTLILSDYSFTARRPNMEYIEKYNEYVSDLKGKLQLLNDRRIRWLDGMGISKEMRLHGEWGENHISQSQHFHHFCNETFEDNELNIKTMNVCSNITEMVAQLLLNHALETKNFVRKHEKDASSKENGETSLRYCHACPKRLLPFHITPRPEITCEMGPLHERTDSEEMSAVCSKNSESVLEMCPDHCMKEDVSYQFISQSDVVNVRECSMQTTSSVDEAADRKLKLDSNIEGSPDPVKGEEAIPSWLQYNLADVNSSDECDDSDIPFYWNIPESAGVTIQNLYWCIGLTLANELGTNPKFLYGKDTNLVKFLPFKGKEWSVLNVDTSTKEGILRAKDLGLAFSKHPSVDLLVSSHLRFATKELFDRHHKAKIFAIFRHPVARELVHQSTIDNWMVRNLVGKEDSNLTLTYDDLDVAKEIIRTKVKIGLENRFVKSFDRFNSYLGIKIHKRWTRGRCIREYARTKRIDVTATTDESKAISERNTFDVLLYEYAEALFNEEELT